MKTVLKNTKRIGSKEYVSVYDVIRHRTYHIAAEDISIAGTKAMEDIKEDGYYDEGHPDYRYLVLKQSANIEAKTYGVRPTQIGIHVCGDGFCHNWHNRIIFMVSPKTLKKIGFNPS